MGTLLEIPLAHSPPPPPSTGECIQPSNATLHPTVQSLSSETQNHNMGLDNLEYGVGGVYPAIKWFTS